RHRGPWPKISVWHGASDPIVKPFKGEDIIRQWTNVHGLSDSPSYQESIGSHTRRIWNDANGKVLIEAFSISGMAHGVPLATTTGGESCGAAGAFFLDVGISSTHHIARFWRLHESLVEMPHAAVPGPHVRHETPRVHHAHRRRGGRVAARGARASPATSRSKGRPSSNWYSTSAHCERPTDCFVMATERS